MNILLDYAPLGDLAFFLKLCHHHYPPYYKIEGIHWDRTEEIVDKVEICVLGHNMTVAASRDDIAEASRSSPNAEIQRRGPGNIGDNGWREDFGNQNLMDSAQGAVGVADKDDRIDVTQAGDGEDDSDMMGNDSDLEEPHVSWAQMLCKTSYALIFKILGLLFCQEKIQHQTMFFRHVGVDRS